jgi:hypothetical protein
MLRIASTLLFLSQLLCVSSHGRLTAPFPDDYVASGAGNAAQGTENCGHNPKYTWGGVNSAVSPSGTGLKYTSFTPGFATIRIQELAGHTGPYRLCLIDSNEVCRYVLADHIPQNSAGQMNYKVTVWLPNVKCDAATQCKIQMMWVLTNSNPCVYYDRNPTVQTTLPTGACTSICKASITIELVYIAFFLFRFSP